VPCLAGKCTFVGVLVRWQAATSADDGLAGGLFRGTLLGSTKALGLSLHRAFGEGLPLILTSGATSSEMIIFFN